MPDQHAVLSPSSAARWINCPGSVRLSQQLPPAPSSTYADEGTLAHRVAELKLRVRSREINPVEYATGFRACLASEYWCGELDEATDYYVDAVFERWGIGGSDAELMVEQRFSLDKWAPGSFGTSDAVVIGNGALEVIDLKYGKGVKVSAVENPQLRLYALGAADLFEDLYDFERVRMTIIQPRLDQVSVDMMTLRDLRDWGKNIVQPAAYNASNGAGETAAGEWCRWCPAKAVCRTRADENLKLARYDFKEPELLEPEEIGEILKQAEELQKWTADVQAYALQQALDGEHFDGWKLVEGRSVRKYADDLKVAETLQAAGFPEAALYERKLYGITAMEKIVGKKKLTEILGDLIIKPAGKPVLVPDSDKREAINTAAAAAADFIEED
jgi:hypothetical protein